METTFCDLTYCIPEDWEALTWDDDQQDHVNYNYVRDGEYGFPLDISAYDAISTMTDLALFDMLVMGEIDPEETRVDKLARMGKTELRTRTIEETEICDIEGVDAVKFVLNSTPGHEWVRYDILTEGYYYKFEFMNNVEEVTEDFSEIIDQVMNSIIVTPAE